MTTTIKFPAPASAIAWLEGYFDADGPEEARAAVAYLKEHCIASESAPSFVWAVESKTSFALFGTEEAAKQYVSGFPASVGGGMGIAKLAVIGGQK